MHFRLDYPPSVNHYWRHWQGRTVLSARGKAYRYAATDYTPSATITDPVRVCLELTMPDGRRRDIDNVAKAVLDAIGHAGIYQDDSQVHELIVRRVGVQPPGCVDVYVEVIE